MTAVVLDPTSRAPLHRQVDEALRGAAGRGALLLGYAAVPEDAIDEGVRRLEAALG
ncbi:hypothetical protein [Sorangium sp. So ce1335]|uniref:hypothetical protein n=1 Tax=Sorangium sp. So ce1335 TaxID=3133335 RepID=UPI003F6226BA